jgi:hypothetical protein
MLSFCNSYVLWLLRCVQLRLVTVTFCDVNVVWCYVLSQYRILHNTCMYSSCLSPKTVRSYKWNNMTRETGEGFPCLTVWNWSKWGLKEYIWKEFFLGLFVGLAGTRDFFSALAALVGPVQNIFFLRRTLFTLLFVPIAQLAGQAVVPRRLSIRCVSGGHDSWPKGHAKKSFFI